MIPQKVERWCEQNEWTEPVLKDGRYYAFPPNAVMPMPIPAWWNVSIWRSFVDSLQQPRISSLVLMSSLMICYYLTLLLCFFLWDWRGIGSVYISQVENQKFLACYYCPITPGSLVEMKSSSRGLQEVQTVTISKPTKLRLTKNMGELVIQEEVKGRVLYLFPPK